MVHPGRRKSQNFLPFQSIVWTDHISLIRSSVHGPLGCLPLLGVVNSAAMNLGMYLIYFLRKRFDCVHGYFFEHL